MEWYIILAQALWIIFPAYVANASAVLVGGGKPIDGGRMWKDGKRVLGDGKTWRGLFSGAFLGMTSGFAMSIGAYYINASEIDGLTVSTFLGFPLMIPLLFCLCFGALFGDITESFFKRRLGKDRGEDWLVFDQLDFIVGALLFSLLFSLIQQVVTGENWFFMNLNMWHLVVLLVLTPIFHLTANFILRVLRGQKQKAKT